MKQLCTPCTIKVNSATSDAELKNAKIWPHFRMDQEKGPVAWKKENKAPNKILLATLIVEDDS